MPVENVAINNLESYQPTLDYRRTGQIGVTFGRNFAWDVSGIYAAYASRLVAGGSSIGGRPNIVQELDLGDRIHLASGNKVYGFVGSSDLSPVGTWTELATLTEFVPVPLTGKVYNYRKWTAAYLADTRLACNYYFGVYEVTPGSPDTYTRITQAAVPGFPDDNDPVIAIGETNGRMLYLTETTIYFSAPADPLNLIPALGGAGFQVLSDRIGGKPYAMLCVANGAIIWTTGGTLAMEFIGGDLVFRYWVMNTEVKPLSAFSITKLAVESHIIMTRLGLHACTNLNAPQAITPVFNEYLREYFRTHESEQGHVWYSIVDNRLYVGFYGHTKQFERTIALDLGIDRWGIWNVLHIGLFRYGYLSNQFGYADNQGRVSYLLGQLDGRKDRENPNAPGTFLGLDSEVIIGWIRARGLDGNADMTQELQEVYVDRAPPDRQAETVVIDEGLLTDAIILQEDEGLLTDWNEDFIFDEGLIPNRETTFEYQMEWLSDLFNQAPFAPEDNAVTPIKVFSSEDYDMWVGVIPARFHRIRVMALEPNEYYRINTLNASIAYMGQQS